MQTNPQSTTARLQIEPGFVWDGLDGYLFDIDGTLMRSRDRIHVDSFAEGVRQVTGLQVSLEGVPVHGGTDTAILSEACRLAGIPNEILAPQTPAILAAIRAYVAERRSQLQPYLMPGVEATLAHLSGKGALLGVATGNLEEIGWIKLEEAGLRHWFHFGGFSDRFPIRPELVADAARQARAIAGRDARLCVVGDTPRDIAAAHANNLPVIAVATGRYSFEELLADKPQLCVSSLADLLAATQVAS